MHWRCSAGERLGIIPLEFMMVLYPLLSKFSHDVVRSVGCLGRCYATATNHSESFRKVAFPLPVKAGLCWCTQRIESSSLRMTSGPEP